MKLGIAGLVLSMFDRLNNSHATDYDPKTDVLTIQVPDLGPKSLDVPSTEIDNFVGVIAAYSPDESLTLAETVRRTLSYDEKKEVYSFRTSLATGTRTVTVSKADWPDFVRFWTEAADSVEGAIESWKAHLAEVEAAANAE
jgi:hypothetical protein